MVLSTKLNGRAEELQNKWLYIFENRFSHTNWALAYSNRSIHNLSGFSFLETQLLEDHYRLINEIDSV